MAVIRNVAFIMCDQLRADYLGCAGHPTLRTPNIDALAARGVRFERAYCQAPVCGPSRMSFYTGRYCSSHGSTSNGVPLRADEWTMGDYLRPHGVRTAVVGKTHCRPDVVGLSRFGIDGAGAFSACGFEPVEHDDGMWPDAIHDPDLAYNRYLRSHGFGGSNPWHSHANSVRGGNGEVLSGWNMRNCRYPSLVPDEHSETAYMTDRAIAFVEDMGEAPWCLHLSYIKPHWPYVAPAPYHRLYGLDDAIAANRSDGERKGEHPLTAAYREHQTSREFHRPEVRDAVTATYMGLVSQIDTHIGRFMACLEERGRLDDTLIVFTSDHGDFLGDHWLGEKELFYEEAVRIPMIVVDPGPAADATRGSVSADLVEAIDVLPTILDSRDQPDAGSRLEGRSLLPVIHGLPAERREAVVSELDFYWFVAQRDTGLDLNPAEARSWMVRTEDWKYVRHAAFPPRCSISPTIPGNTSTWAPTPPVTTSGANWTAGSSTGSGRARSGSRPPTRT